ncbi:MAG: hypothetical protein ED557_00090 [Balneola sp.]|nr:MAG: hypothetical protein ED557_00090 [Balneola sp.]
MSEFFQSIVESPILQALAIILGIAAPAFGIVMWVIKSAKNKNQKPVNFKQSQEEFVIINKKFGGLNRTQISRIAHSINLDYLKDEKFLPLEELPLLCIDRWIPEKPVPLESISCSLIDEKAPELNPVKLSLPYTDEQNHFPLYTSAVKELLKPKIFEDNRQYRFLDLESDGSNFQFNISRKPYSYFYKINYGKGVQHELISELLRINKIDLFDDVFSFDKTPKIKSLPFRRKVLEGLKNTETFNHTVVLGGVSTLTLLYDGNSFRFLLHERGSGQGYAANIRHVIPAGEYQPLSKGDNFSKDLPLWNNTMREYAEELGNLEEFKGEEGKIFDYSKTSPFSDYLREVEQGNIKNFFLGFGLDPLSLQAEVVSVSIFKEDTFNELFGPTPFTNNDEGVIITEADRWGIPFTKEEVDQRLEEGLLAAGDSALRLAFKHLEFLKNSMDN